ncbi:MAG: AIR synthase family protein [Fusobacteria bacterium]|nr:AIR synthase family protein [Fusobacteriota bacterium]
MKAGKLTIEQLKSIVFPYTGTKRQEVVVHAAIGEDCSVIDLGGELCVISTDPITGASKDNGYLGVHVACNDVIASGGKPLGILVTMLLKEETLEEDITMIIEGIDKACKELEIEIIGGHTEITTSVKENILSLTALGTKEKSYLAAQSEIEAGDEIILTKGGAIEGTSIIFNDYGDRFIGLVPDRLITEGQEMLNWLSIYKEGMIARENGAKVMHDVTEGGILGGVYELAETTDLGIEIEEKNIYFHKATLALKEVFKELDLLRLISSGSLLIVAAKEANIVAKLKENGVESFVIGHFTENKDRIIKKRNNEIAKIEEPKSDELWTLIEKLKER